MNEQFFFLLSFFFFFSRWFLVTVFVLAEILRFEADLVKDTLDKLEQQVRNVIFRIFLWFFFFIVFCSLRSDGNVFEIDRRRICSTEKYGSHFAAGSRSHSLFLNFVSESSSSQD